MFTAIADALFRRTQRSARWDPPKFMNNREAHRRHIDQEAAFRAHLMRHTHYR